MKPPKRPRVVKIEDDEFVWVAWTAKDGTRAEAMFSLVAWHRTPAYVEAWKRAVIAKTDREVMLSGEKHQESSFRPHPRRSR